VIRDQKLVLGQTDNSLSCPGPSLSYLRVLVRREPELLRNSLACCLRALIDLIACDLHSTHVHDDVLLPVLVSSLYHRLSVSRVLRCNQLIMTTITIILVLEWPVAN
jgi:hypothetical protein